MPCSMLLNIIQTRINPYKFYKLKPSHIDRIHSQQDLPNKIYTNVEKIITTGEYS